MTNNQIINDNYILINDICSNVCKDINLLDDFKQEMFLIILEKDNEKLNLLIEKKEFKFFLIKICTNNWNSKTSRFYYKYKKRLTEEQTDNIKKIFYD